MNGSTLFLYHGYPVPFPGHLSKERQDEILLEPVSMSIAGARAIAVAQHAGPVRVALQAAAFCASAESRRLLERRERAAFCRARGIALESTLSNSEQQRDFMLWCDAVISFNNRIGGTLYPVTEPDVSSCMSIDGVRAFEALFAFTVQFIDQAHYDRAQAVTGWAEYDRHALILEAKHSVGEGLEFPAILVNKVAYRGFCLRGLADTPVKQSVIAEPASMETI